VDVPASTPKFSYRIHERISRTAFDAVNFDESCGNSWVKEDAILWSNDYDFIEGSQDIENSHTHAMSQGERYYVEYDRSIRVRPLETRQQAQVKWRAFIEENLALCLGPQLGYALHAMQDHFAKGHLNFEYWDGGYTFLGLPGWAHIDHDTWPTDLEDAQARWAFQRY
jgi:hypothetical protein